MLATMMETPENAAPMTPATGCWPPPASAETSPNEESGEQPSSWWWAREKSLIRQEGGDFFFLPAHARGYQAVDLWSGNVDDEGL